MKLNLIIDPSEMGTGEKLQAFMETVAMLGEALEIPPIDFVAMLQMITEKAEEALGECICGNCPASQDATKH
jgi:hypothetical protein